MHDLPRAVCQASHGVSHAPQNFATHMPSNLDFDQHILLAFQAPCQHNFCLKCFQSLVNRGGKSCPTCRQEFGAKFAANPRINTALTVAIRSFKAGASSAAAKACER